MVRALSLCSAAAIALSSGPAVGAAPPARTTVDVRVVIVSASGKGGPPSFDPRIPQKVRAILSRLPLNYSRYELVAVAQRSTPLGRAVLFPLTDKRARSLRVQASARDPAARIVRVDGHILPRDRTQPAILTVQWRASYGRVFFLHYARSKTSALLMGVSVHK